MLICRATPEGDPVQFVAGAAPAVRAFISTGSFLDVGHYLLIPLSYHAVNYKLAGSFYMSIHSSKVVGIAGMRVDVSSARRMLVDQVVRKGRHQDLGSNFSVYEVRYLGEKD